MLKTGIYRELSKNKSDSREVFKKNGSIVISNNANRAEKEAENIGR